MTTSGHNDRRLSHGPPEASTQTAGYDLEISDELWRRIEAILLEFWPKKPTGRKVADWRKMLNAIIFRMPSGCQWDQLPERYGPKSTVHDWFQRWAAAGIFERIWAVLVAECDELGGVQWEWQPADAMLGKARFGGEKDGQESHRPRKKGFFRFKVRGLGFLSVLS